MRLLTVTEREKNLRDELVRIVDILKREYNPVKIVLFGSLAVDKIHTWSDIDLLIVKDTTKRPIDRCVEIAGLVHPKVGVDLFVYTPEEYKLLLNERFSFLMRIVKEGKVLYEKGD